MLVSSVHEMGAPGNAQLARAAYTIQVAAQVISVLEAEALYRAARRSVTGSGLGDLHAGAIGGQAASVLDAVLSNRFDGAYSVEQLMAELSSAIMAADDVELILPQAEAAMHLLELLAVIGGADKAPSALSLIYGEEADCAAQGLDWTRAEEAYGNGKADDGYDDFDGCGCDHDHDHVHDEFDDYEGGTATTILTARDSATRPTSMLPSFSDLNPTSCSLCPRRCGARRAAGSAGRAGADDKVLIARAALHFWEEPPISGTAGSGTVFFAHCPLRCSYCQNTVIAHGALGYPSNAPIFATYASTWSVKGALNVNFVTPTHYAPHVRAAVRAAREGASRFPWCGTQAGTKPSTRFGRTPAWSTCTSPTSSRRRGLRREVLPCSRLSAARFGGA